MNPSQIHQSLNNHNFHGEVSEENTQEISDLREFISTITAEDWKNSTWLIKITGRAVQSYDKNARAEYFMNKYAGLPKDEIADRFILNACGFTSILGALSGLSATGGIGMAITGAMIEMPILTYFQTKMILDIAVIYDKYVDPNDSEEMLKFLYMAVGIGGGADLAGGMIVQRVGQAQVESWLQNTVLVGKEVGSRLHTVKTLLRKSLGLSKLPVKDKIIGRLIPGVAVGIGFTYNSVSTWSIGQLAKARFKSQMESTAFIQEIINTQHVYSLAFRAAMLHLANVDGEYHNRENTLYRQLIKLMQTEERKPRYFDEIAKHEGSLLEALAEIENPEHKQEFIELLMLMAAYDGKITDEEKYMLTKITQVMQVKIDFAALEARAEQFASDMSNSGMQSIVNTLSRVMEDRVQNSAEQVQAANQLMRASIANLLKINLQLDADKAFDDYFVHNR